MDEGLSENIFSLCLDIGGGVLIIGGNDVTLYTGLLQYTPIVSTNGYFLSATVCFFSLLFVYLFNHSILFPFS